MQSYALASMSLQGSKMRTLRKPSESEVTTLWRLKLCKTQKRWWYHISFKVFWERALYSKVRRNSSVHPDDELSLSYPSSYMPSRKRMTASRLKLSCTKSNNSKIRSPDPVETRVLPVILDRGTLLRRIMRHNSPSMATDVTHHLDTLVERTWSPFSHPPPSPFLPLFDEKKEDDMAAEKGKKKLEFWMLVF